MQDPITITRVNRKALEKILNNYSLEQLNIVPEGFKNNLIWNIAHVIVVQQVLTYTLSGLKPMINDQMIERYRKGTKTEATVNPEEVEKIKKLLFSTLDKTEKDIGEGVFKTYREYETSTGFVIKSAQDAINFNNYHEGLHLGYILALKKAV